MGRDSRCITVDDERVEIEVARLRKIVSGVIPPEQAVNQRVVAYKATAVGQSLDEALLEVE